MKRYVSTFIIDFTFTNQQKAIRKKKKVITDIRKL